MIAKIVTPIDFRKMKASIKPKTVRLNLQGHQGTPLYRATNTLV